ncbi:GTPase domain-containing protein, partial [Escherichia coli]|nr:GTPase domain-containing protein [Escherichia coli]
GSSKSEHDGARGQSATQSTAVYTVDIDNTRVRLIDTPGIGDTRGLEQDNKNMADILHVLRTYKKLHGILILLKPNASRLTVMFRLCIK